MKTSNFVQKPALDGNPRRAPNAKQKQKITKLFLVKGPLLMQTSETLTFKLLGIFEMSATGTLAIVAATILAAAVIIHAYGSR